MPTVLVADDNSNIQKAVVTALKDHGIEVLTVGNGEAAVRKLTDSHPDLILADIFMPVRNGYEVCEYVKKDDRFAHIPVVLLVGAFDPLDDHEVERVHADGVLKKPFVPPDPLIQLVKSFLERSAPAAAEAAPEPEPEDSDRTQDVASGLAGRSPSGTVQIPAVERTQRLDEPPAHATAEVPEPDRTQPVAPHTAEAPPSLENFELGLSEPKPAQPMEKTQQLNAQAISDILHRESPLGRPAEPEEEVEDFGAHAPVVEMDAGESPVAFEDLLQAPEAGEAGHIEHEEAEVTEEEEEAKPMLGYEAFAAAEEQTREHEEPAEISAEEQAEAELHFGGIREEAKTPDPERPPIPVVFDKSEPAEIITEDHVESSGMEIGPAEDLVSSSSGWASTEAHGVTHPSAGREPELLPEGAGSEGFMSAPLPGPAPRSAPPAPAQEFAIPSSAPVPSPDEFEETAKLNAGILQEEVARAQQIAARIAAQNREALAHETVETAAIAGAAGPTISRAISAVDEMLARHRAPDAPDAPAEPVRAGTGTEQIPMAEAAAAFAAPAETPAPPVAAAARAGTGTEQVPIPDLGASGRMGTGTEQIPVAEVAAAEPRTELITPEARLGTGTEQIPAAEFAGIAGAAVAASAPPAAPGESRPGTGTLQLSAEEVAAQARAATSSPELMEAMSERVLAQLDPYLIEKISKEIVRPIVEAILKRELEKLE